MILAVVAGTFINYWLLTFLPSDCKAIKAFKNDDH